MGDTMSSIEWYKSYTKERIRAEMATELLKVVLTETDSGYRLKDSTKKNIKNYLSTKSTSKEFDINHSEDYIKQLEKANTEIEQLKEDNKELQTFCEEVVEISRKALENKNV